VHPDLPYRVIVAGVLLASACDKRADEPAPAAPVAPSSPPEDARSWKTIELPETLPGWKLPAAPAAPAPAAPPPGLDVAGLCDGGFLTWFVLEHRGERLHTLDAARAIADLPASVELEAGRHHDDRGLDLARLLAEHPDAAGLRLHSCTDPVRVIPRSAARGWVLVTNQRGQLKLVGPDAGGEPLRRIVLVELVDRL